MCICLCVHVLFVTVACCVYGEIQGEYNHQTVRGGKITLFSRKVADKTPHINHTPARGFSGCESIFNTARLVTPKVIWGFSIGFNINYDFGMFGNIVTATWRESLGDSLIVTIFSTCGSSHKKKSPQSQKSPV